MSIEEIVAALQVIVEGAEGRDLTDEEVSRYEELEGKLTTARKSAEVRSRQTAYTTPVGTPRVAVKADVDEESRGFVHYLQTGQKNSDLVLVRAQSEGTPSEGGYLVPDGFRNKLVERMKDFAGLANHVEHINTGSGNPIEWPTVDDTGNVGEIVAENGTFAAGSDVVFGTATLGAYKYMSGGAGNLPIRVSVELIQDSAFDIEAYLAKAMATRIARVQAVHWVKGTGSGQPLGITYGKTGIMAAANTGLTYADLVTYVHSVDPAYRMNAKWAFNDSTLAAIRKLDDANDRPLWAPATDGLSGSMPGGTLLGYPVVIDQAFDNYSAASNTVNWGVFGDLAESYVIRDVHDLSMVVDPYTRAANGQIQYTAWLRADGTVQNPNSYVALTGKA